MADQTGRTVLVTGANSGLGFSAARELARHGARVLMACRNADRAEAAVGRLRNEIPGANVEFRLLDLADLGSVRAFAEGLDADRLDVLINNAGVMGMPRGSTRDGFETHVGTNHLGPFALTGLLMPRLLSTPGSRVVNVSSAAHWIGRLDPSRLGEQRRYQRWVAYGRSKTAALLFTRELSRLLAAARASTVAIAAHPGYAATELQAKAASPSGTTVVDRMLMLGNRFAADTPEAGAQPILFAACAPEAGRNGYYGPGVVHRKAPVAAWPAPWARDDRAARALWQESERLTGVHYPL